MAAGGMGGGSDALPALLSATGLYTGPALDQLSPGVEAYTPRFELWSDGADKQRWLLLPPGTQIDTSDMDHWRFPTGTKVWKEFSQQGRRLETRLLWKSERGWLRASYVWDEPQREAALAPNRGATDVLGTNHDVPGRTGCDECHEGVPDRLLGVSAIQLSHDRPGLTLQQLIDAGRLTDAPLTGDLRTPDDVTWRALGYLHANCGNCHSPSSVTWDRLDLDLWLRSDQLRDAADTTIHRSSVGVAVSEAEDGPMRRVAPGDPANSALVFRMTLRDGERAMPPLASEATDDAGLALVRTWIEGL